MFRELSLASALAVTACAGSGGGVVEVDSGLTGVYRVDRYVGNQDGCDNPTGTIPPNAFLVLYGFRPPNDPTDVFLGGNFCSDVRSCQQLARTAPQPQIGYSFIGGTDDSGWEGWAVLGGDVRGDQCFAIVQEHAMSPVAGTPASIRIETRTVETATFEPSSQEGNQIECRVADAVSAAMGQPCREILVLEASHEAGL